MTNFNNNIKNAIIRSREVDAVGTAKRTPTIKRVSKRRRTSAHERNLTKITKMRMLLKAIEANFIVHENFRLYSQRVMSLYDSLYRDHGMVRACAWFKNSRLALTRYVTGYPLSSVELLTLVDGIPSWILDIDPTLNSRRLSDAEFRMWHTLLSVSRAFTAKPVLDISSIVDPSKNQSQLITDFELQMVYKELNMSRYWWSWKKFHLTTKSGPNGQALASCLDDLNRLPKRLYDALKFLGGKGFKSKMS